MASLESVVKTLTGEADYLKAVRKMTSAGLISRPIDDLAVKLFAYRGNEPGVAHGSASMPRVSAPEARLVFNMAASLGAYVAEVARREPDV